MKTKKLRPKAVPYNSNLKSTQRAIFLRVIEPSFMRQFRLMKKWFKN